MNNHLVARKSVSQNRSWRSIVTAAALGILAAPLPTAAQWLHYPSVGVPRTPEGKPNLAAPAPKMPDGKPDLSGIWTMQENRSCPPGGCDDMLASQEFLNIGWSLKGGLPYQPWAAEAVKARSEQYGKDDPQTHCLPTGVVKMHTDLLMRKIVQVPGALLIINERNTTYRQIFTDGRPLPVGPQEARASLDLCTAVYVSALTGTSVAMPIASTHPYYAGVTTADYDGRRQRGNPQSTTVRTRGSLREIGR